jgi:cytochrome c553
MRIVHRLGIGGAGLLSILVLAGAASAASLEMPGITKVYACSACHGFNGHSPSDTMPILAGMDQAYFKKAIQDYATGKRPSPEMEPYAKMVLVIGVDDVAVYFAKQPRRPTPIRVDSAAVERGRAASVQCQLCHGPDGRGDPAKNIPDLRGQPPGYLVNQLMLFKADRRSPGDEILKPLKVLMKTLSDQTMADLAAFYSSQR